MICCRFGVGQICGLCCWEARLYDVCNDPRARKPDAVSQKQRVERLAWEEICASCVFALSFSELQAPVSPKEGHAACER